MSKYPTASLEIQITRTTIFDGKKEVLLSNPRNKQRFLKLLSSAHTESGIRSVNCEEDANVEIVEAAMKIALEKSVCVLADDADITVLLIHKIFELLSSGVSLPIIYQLRVGVVYDMVAVTNVLPAALKNSLLVIHAFYGSDTTSRLYNHGYAAITSNKIPSKAIADVFNNKDSSMDDIFTAGDNIMKS